MSQGVMVSMRRELLRVPDENRERALAPADEYCRIRQATERLIEPLSAEDMAVQSMSDASPTKWHLAHTTWFFERMVLRDAVAGYQPFDPSYDYLFNSYYESLGPRQPRERRGLSPRPSLEEILDYRQHVDANMLALLCRPGGLDAGARERTTVALHHEQQHQELVLTDIKHALWSSGRRSVYRPDPDAALLGGGRAAPPRWHRYPTSLVQIGASGDGFCFDNERPRHQALVHGFELASRPVTCGEFAEFVVDHGYERPELWLADGWAAVQREGWRAPLYWREAADGFVVTTLSGQRPLEAAEPVCHVSYYEADAYARWARARLPTEQEWEVAALGAAVDGNLLESGALHPMPAAANGDGGPQQLFGDVWEWTQSPYVPYPGFVPWGGPLGEYNAKFMCNQLVLRGGSCATPRSHIRPSYRNYFPPQARWQFSGLRLAR